MVEFFSDEEKAALIAAALREDWELTEEKMRQVLRLAREIRIAASLVDLAIKGELAVVVRDGQLLFRKHD